MTFTAVKVKKTTLVVWVVKPEDKSMEQAVNDVLLHEQDENGAIFRDMKPVGWNRTWLILDYPEEHRS